MLGKRSTVSHLILLDAVPAPLRALLPVWLIQLQDGHLDILQPLDINPNRILHTMHSLFSPMLYARWNFPTMCSLTQNKSK